MFQGMSTYTLVHVAISLIGIFAGLVVAVGLLAGNRLNRWTSLFLIFTALTSLTGFFFPFEGFKPSYVVGIISLILLAIASFARYSRNLAGGWRKTYVITAMMALYLNVFVGVVQTFEKTPGLKDTAPKVTQIVVLTLFVVLTILAAVRFRDDSLTRA